MATIRSTFRRPRRGRHSGIDATSREIAGQRLVVPGVWMPPHYDPRANDGGTAREGSAIAAAPLAAAVVPAENYVRSLRQRWGAFTAERNVIGEVKNWEAALFHFLREGPGFVAAAVNLYADWLAAGAQLIVQERADRDDQGRDVWVTTSYEPAWEILGMWRGHEESQADLLRKLIRFLDGPGQTYQTMAKVEGRWGYELWAHSAVKYNADSGKIECRTRPDAQRGDPWFFEHDPRLVDHLFHADLEWPGMPTSQMQRVMPEIYRILLSDRSMDRAVSSRLASNGLLWAPAAPGGRNWTEEFVEWAKLSYTATIGEDYIPGVSTSLEEVAPFPMVSETRPEFIDIGRDINQAMIPRDIAWRAFCLGIDAPPSALEGSQDSSRWSGFLARDEDMMKAAAPRMQRVASMILATHMRPWWRILRVARPAEDFRIWFELPDLRPQNTDEKLRVIDQVIPRRSVVAETVGWNAEDLADLPEGMTEFEAAILLKFGKTYEQILAEAKKAGEPAPAPAAPAAAKPAGPQPDGDGTQDEGPLKLAPGVREPAEPDMPDTAQETSDDGPVEAALRPLPAERASWDRLIP